MKSIEQRALELLSTEFRIPIEEVTLCSDLRDDLKADSLDLIELLMATEGHFEIVIDDNDEKFYALRTTTDYIAYVTAALEKKNGASVS